MINNRTWKSHIHNVARKVSKAIGIIYKSSFCLNNSSLRMLYFSLIYPYLFYCVSVWASTYPSNLRRLITLQKRVVRIMSRSAFDAHTDPLFKNLKILNLESIYKLQIGKFMYQYRSGLLPYSFNNMFLVTRQVHSYGIRSSEHFYLPQCRTNVRKFWQMPSQASRSLQLQDIAFIRSDYVQKPVSNSYGYCSLWLRSWIALIPVRSAQCTWFMVYRTRNITFEARLFWYMAYRKMNILHVKHAFLVHGL